MIIDTENLDTLSLQELALLLLLYDKRLDKSKTSLEIRDVDIKAIYEKLEKRGYVITYIYETDHSYTPPVEHYSWTLLERGKQQIAENCLQDQKVIKVASERAINERCQALAIKLMEVYPLGNKPDTSLKWRGNQRSVAEKLKKLILEGFEFTDKEAIEATKAYVGSFNGIYTTMRILPYFIKKNTITGGELNKTSDFMDYVEDLRANPKQGGLNKNWETELK